MKRSKASLADTPSGRPRHQTPRWVKRTFAVCAMLLVGRTVQGLWLPSLTPEQAADVDADTQYARWEASPQGENFLRLQKLAATLRADERAIGDCYMVLRLDPLKPPTLEEIASAERNAQRLLLKHKVTLRELRDGYGDPLSLPPLRTFVESTPYLGDFRTLGRLNVVSAEMKRRAGDPDGAAQELIYGLEYGSRLMRGGNSTGRSVGIGCQVTAGCALWKLLPNISRSAYSGLMPALRDATYTPPVADTFAVEKRFGQRMLLQAWGDRRGGKGATVQFPFTILSFVWPRRAVFGSHTAYTEEWEKISATPYVHGEEKPTEPTDWVNNIFLPIFTNLRYRDVQLRAGNALLMQAAELHTYRAEKGRFPDRLEELSPQFALYPELLPRDPFGQNRPLQYRKQADGFLLYSLGPDGRDDGGKPICRAKTKQGVPTRGRSAYVMDETSTGDMVGGVNF